MHTELAYSRLDKFGILQCVIGYFVGKYLVCNLVSANSVVAHGNVPLSNKPLHISIIVRKSCSCQLASRGGRTASLRIYADATDLEIGGH